MSTEKVSEAIGKCVRQNVSWTNLPVQLRQMLHNKCDYDKFIFNYSLKNQLRFRENLVSTVFRYEQRYYELVVQKSINSLCLFPYHLADVVTRGLRVTPFNYYVDILSQLLRKDKSYDTLPNFTAADCLRVLGIGRNEYLSLISDLKTHSTRTLIFSNKPNPLEFLPRVPVRIHIEPWWRVKIGCVLETDIRYVNTAERSLIDDLIDFGSQTCSKCDYEVVHTLYRKGLIYLDVPISDEDRFCIPPLRNFVMNRVSGDYFENLLYKIFLSADEHMTIHELSQMLQVDLNAVKQAVSFFCRLGFAQIKECKVTESGEETSKSAFHPSWNKYKEDYCKLRDSPQITPLNYSALLHTGEIEAYTKNWPNAVHTVQSDSPSPIAITLNRSGENSAILNDNKDNSSMSYLSSDGNTSDLSFVLPSPVPHMPTTRNIDEPELSSEMDDLSDSTTKVSIKELPATSLLPKTQKPKETRTEKTGKRVGFVFDSTLTAFLMMGNLSPGLKNHAVTMFEVGKLCEESLDTLLAELEKVSLLDAEGEGDVSRYFAHAVILRSTICSLRNLVPGGLDLLRLECLECLDQKTRDRVLEKKYKFIISAAPLTATVSNLFSIPFFGQFYRSSDSSHMWTKLFYNHITGYGPPSLFLCRGTVLKTLPRIFLGYGKLLVNILHSDSYVINSENFPNLNEQLKSGCVLIQGYGIRTPGEVRFEAFPFDADDPRQTDWINHKAVQELREHLDLKHYCGYITFLNTGVPDFGCESYELQVRLRHPNSKMKNNITGDDFKKPDTAFTNVTLKAIDIGADASQSSPEKSTNSTEVTSFAHQHLKEQVNDLKSPDENYFANTPQNGSNHGSPSNIFTSEDCNELLATELAKCDSENAKVDNDDIHRDGVPEAMPAEHAVVNVKNRVDLVSQGSVEITLNLISTENSCDNDAELAKTTEPWTLLDVHFGVPLFDVDANTRICENIVRHLSHEVNLAQLPIAAAQMNDTFLNFVQKCLYFEDEQHEQFKIGKVLPQPRLNLAFENGRVCYWSGR